MKIAILSDLHFGKRDVNFLNRQLEFFEKQFFPYLLENKISEVFQLGDVYDLRKYSLNQMLSEVAERFFKFFIKNKINLHIIVGNHDSPMKESAKFSPLYQFKSSKYIDIINNNKILDLEGKKIAMHSYFCKDFLEADIGLFHHDFIGKKMNKNSICEEGIEFPHINYKKVYSGHYHGSDDPIYLKTPFALSFENHNDNNGFMILDLESMNEHWITNNINQKFIKVYYFNQNHIEIDGLHLENKIINSKDYSKIVGDNIVEFNIESIDDKIILDKLIEENSTYIEYKYSNYFLNDPSEIDQNNRNDFLDNDFNNISFLYDGFVDSIGINELSGINDKDELKKDFLQIYSECNIEESK